MRFLDAAISRLTPREAEGFMTDGKNLGYAPRGILALYRKEVTLPTHTLLHMFMHCIFRHMFIHTLVDRRCWNLACDIAVEAGIAGLDVKAIRIGTDSQINKELTRLKPLAKMLTAEKLYRCFLDGSLPERELARLETIFTFDNHACWYQKEDQPQKESGSGGDGAELQNGSGKNTSIDASQEEGSGSDPSDLQLSSEEDWKQIAQHIEEDLETFSKAQGDKAGGMMQNLAEVNREKYDYAAFLKKFAVMGEVMRINDDEFDYIYYTYGMKLYHRMPLIEPLEYKDVKRIREFVIAIDTSGSTSGELVQRFVQKTYNILKSTESFFSKINLHIIQCDADIQEHVRITTEEEFDRYLKSMKIHGLGGTDFRPVFSLVNRLIDQKEFRNLKGLIYFTDGFGPYPERKPDYETAFVFLDDDYHNPNVPPWAIRLILKSDEV